MNRKIKVNFVDFHGDLDKENNDFRDILRKHYDVVVSEQPDYLFYSVFGHEFIKYDCVRIFYTGECVVPDFNLCDYAIGFEQMTYGDRYIRVPLYQLFQYKAALQAAVERSTESSTERAFCSFVCSNDSGMGQRQQIFDLLSQYKKVDSGGRFLNNIGGPVADKFEFDKKHKFSIAFENCIAEGYTTEKIIQAFAAGTIPIYLGNPSIVKEINPKAFVNCQDFSSLQEVVEHVIRIDTDDMLYRKMVQEPVFVGSPPTLEDLERFLLHIVEQPLADARRRPQNNRIREAESHAKVTAYYDTYIGMPLKHAKGLIRRLKNKAL